MAESQHQEIFNHFKLNDKQRTAVLEHGRDVVVTAGAGSGKTSTLVARYASLLAEGITPRQAAAITFTRKAAREMRSRLRGKLIELQDDAVSEEQRQLWADLSARMDSARIGTIHSLCSEILRAHPAEAGIDPRFEVLDEGLTAALRIQAVDDTLKLLVQEERFLALLENISTSSLTEILKDLLNRRLEAAEFFRVQVDNRQRLARELHDRMQHPSLAVNIADLRGRSEQELVRDAGDNLAGMVVDLLQLWSAAEKALAAGDCVACARTLFRARREKMSLKSGKKASVKEIVTEIRQAYKELLDPLIGGENPRDSEPAEETEALFDQLLPLLKDAFERVQQSYLNLLEGRQALDFDDLEHLTGRLLENSHIRTRWQAELQAILVDEFQDTNQRQRQIVTSLAGKPGSLFIVGDMRQSIYRFRRADVTVFSEEQQRILRQGGLAIDLDHTYRSHQPLLDCMGELLGAVIGTQPDAGRPYYVPYSPMEAEKKHPPAAILSPHVEFILGLGADTDSARPVASRALAARLLQLKVEGQIEKWDEVALLFRSSTGFPVYEEALEEAGIPFVTVAGRGFYDRPEIRDLLNILRGLADPLDDLSFAGLLRSPAIGLSDAALYLLRRDGQPFWTVLQGDLSYLSESDRFGAQRAVSILGTLLPLVDRVPVAELLKKVVDVLDYRAMLATADRAVLEGAASRAGGRLWRNLDKLLEDAQASRQVTVRDFLEMLQTLNDAGARQGEAPSEAEGAVRLMTIHKAKGLEFGLVVLANAGSGTRNSSENIYLSSDLGVTVKLDPPPMLYRLAKHIDKDQDAAEELRLLYVAMTRAKHKLIISAHAGENQKGEITAGAWAGDLLEAARLDSGSLQQARRDAIEHLSPAGFPLRVFCAAGDLAITPVALPNEQAVVPESSLAPLYLPLDGFGEQPEDEEEELAFETHLWRASLQEKEVPGTVLGSLVHQAIAAWLFPGDPRLEALLQAESFNAGLASESQREDAVQRAVQLLERLQMHSLWQEISSARERFVEIPYTYRHKEKPAFGKIDLLYCSGERWHILDFKTDPIHNPARREELLREYKPQVSRYRAAVKQLLGVDASARIVFLNDHGRVELVSVY